MQVRPAALEDFRAVCALLAELGRPAVAAGTEGVCRRTFADDVADPAAEHLLAEDDHGAPVGFCSLHFRRRLNHPTPQAWIPDLVVADRARGTGIGRALLTEAERRARGRRCHELVLESGHARTRAHAVYLAAGMQDAGRFFRKPLG